MSKEVIIEGSDGLGREYLPPGLSSEERAASFRMDGETEGQGAVMIDVANHEEGSLAAQRRHAGLD
jgi:hypothetical protein